MYPFKLKKYNSFILLSFDFKFIFFKFNNIKTHILLNMLTYIVKIIIIMKF